MSEDKRSEFDRIADKIQQQIIEDEKKIFSAKVIVEYNNPHNIYRMVDFDSHSVLTGSCGDTMEFYIRLKGDTVSDLSFMTDGCGATVACGSILTRMVEGVTIEEARKVTSSDLIETLEGLPDENLHCANLAVNALRTALNGCEGGA